jgi:hypothetical protein
MVLKIDWVLDGRTLTGGGALELQVELAAQRIQE